MRHRPPEQEAAPPRSSWLLHPFMIALALALAILATWKIGDYRKRSQRDALERALAPLEQEWRALQEQARPRIASVAALLDGAGSPPAGGCAALTGVVTVVHRPMLTALAAGEVAPRTGPVWLNSDAWQNLALASTPGYDADAYQRRNEVVREAIAGPCVGVLEAQQATGARTVGEHRFEGGEVAGRLRIVCVDEARVACEVAIVSRPQFAISLKQRDSRVQAGADAAAVADAASRAYWKAVEAALAGAAPGLRVEPKE